MAFSLNIRGSVREFCSPLVMGVINVTPDSFFAASRFADADAIKQKAAEMCAQGADIIDVGACSTRPGAVAVSEADELQRLRTAIPAIRQACPDVVVSVDTYRSAVASEAVTKLGADMVNDISGGKADTLMFETVAQLHVPYVLMHFDGNIENMHVERRHDDVVADVLTQLAQSVSQLHLLGVSDIIIDPGFGFGKTIDDNYRLLRNLNAFATLGCPVLAGVSRKRMVCEVAGCNADDALAGTLALETLALERGASILRVHDVAQTRRVVKIYLKYTNNTIETTRC